MFSLKQVIARSQIIQPRTLSPGSIGMDIGVDSIHLCQLRPLGDGRYSVLAKVSIPFTGSRKDLLATPKRLKQILLQEMRKKGFSGRRIVTVMPPDELKITPVTYRANAQQADEAILKMLSSRVEGDIADYLIDYLPVRSNPGDEESLALVTIARREAVNSYLQVLTYCGFEVDALDIGPAAIRRLICTLYTGEEKAGETVLVINAGVSRSYLTIISGRRLLFDQPVEFGESLLLDDLSIALDLPLQVSRDLVFRHGLEKASAGQGMAGGMSDKEISQTLLQILKPAFIKLVDEINRVLIFTASETHGSPISRVCVLGSIARWPGAESLLRELVDIPFSANRQEFAEYFVDETDDGEPWTERVPELAIASGLALRGITGDE